MPNTGNEHNTPGETPQSGGPKTDAGKARSSKNAIKTGVFTEIKHLPDHLQSEYQGLEALYLKQFQGKNDYERHLIEQMALMDWRLGRMGTLELEAFAESADDLDALNHRLSRVAKYENSLFKKLQTLKKEVQSLQIQRATIHPSPAIETHTASIAHQPTPPPLVPQTTGETPKQTLPQKPAPHMPMPILPAVTVGQTPNFKDRMRHMMMNLPKPETTSDSSQT